MMGTSKTVAVVVSKKMHAILEDGAKRTGLSLREFTDQVLQAKTQGSLAELGNNLPAQVPAKRDAKGRLLSPDGKHYWLPNIDVWVS